MKYIIMCGGDYVKWEKPRHLPIVNGEELEARTIRLLRENGIEDIAISTNNPIYKKFNIPILHHDNYYIANGIGHVKGDWFNAFYPTYEPACYIFGDVYFSPDAIKKIVETETNDIELFGSKPPFASNYIKTHIEPFALKVMNQKHLRESIQKTREWDKQNKFWRKPIIWELFTVIKNAPLQKTLDEYTADYVGINDYTCDIDFPEDIEKIEQATK
jgi:choline kinase